MQLRFERGQLRRERPGDVYVCRVKACHHILAIVQQISSAFDGKHRFGEGIRDVVIIVGIGHTKGSGPMATMLALAIARRERLSNNLKIEPKSSVG
ncbi:MAG: hypothetical protein H0X24_00765 [Ktedonobacterales bacterium]|nr:hypothetical protein [Ktedonobacterales bacterium]